MFVNFDNRLKRVVMLALMLLTTASICFGQSFWKREYSVDMAIHVSAMAPTTNGNIISVGVGGIGADEAVICIYCVKPNGDTLWAKFPKQRTDSTILELSDMVSLKDGSFIAVGSIRAKYGYFLSLLKIDKNGDILWLKMPLGITVPPYSDWHQGITATQDSNFIVVGTHYDTTDGTQKPFLLKISPDGVPFWTKTYKTNTNSLGHKILRTQDGNFLIVGSNIMKVNPNGDTLWTRTFEGNSYYSIIQTPDGKFIVVGDDLIKIDSNGDTLWTNSSLSGPGYSSFVAIASTRDSNYLVAGGNLNGRGLTKIRPNGDVIWSLPTLFETGQHTSGAINILPLTDGNFVVSAFGGINTTIYIYWNYLFSVIDDQYAYKNVPFTFKIPGSDDSLSYSYSPVNVPPSMTVSKGGTISWTPQTDSVYLEHIVYAVSKGSSINNTLTFNLCVNNFIIDYQADVKYNLPKNSQNLFKANGIVITSFPSYTLISLAFKAVSLGIYDIRGRLVEKLSVVNNTAVWHGSGATGRYFVKPLDGKQNIVKAFVLVR